jgi:hypothetical protein
MKKKSLFIIFFFVSLSIVTLASGNKSDFFIGKWNVEIKGTPGGDSKLIVDLRHDSEEWKGTVSSKKDGTVDIKEAALTEEGMLVSFKSGWFNVELLMTEKDSNHCTCKLAGRYDGKSERVTPASK